MSSKHQALYASHVERRQAAQARRQRKERFWNYLILATAIGMIILFIAIQISHHL